MKLYHQVGHNDVWNRDSFTEDDAGEGLILAPRYIRKSNVEGFSDEIKEASIFDPQFFLPRVPMKKLKTYDFHPDVSSGGFTTQTFSGSQALQSAKDCLQFQIDNSFEKLVIPTRYAKSMPSDLTAQLDDLFVKPYLEAAESLSVDKDLILQLVLNDGMVRDEQYRQKLLNWVTGFQEIDGIYLIVEKKPRQKELEDPSFLLEMLRLIDACVENRLDVILGYCNTEALLYTLAQPSAVTMGSYENMRMFRIGTFEESSGEQRGPKPRLFSSDLLQWIRFEYFGAIEAALGVSKEELFADNKYLREIFSSDFKPHFTKPEIYKHFFMAFSDLVDQVALKAHGRSRWQFVVSKMEGAKNTFEDLDDIGVVLGRHSRGEHLPAFLTAANLYANEKGWQ